MSSALLRTASCAIAVGVLASVSLSSSAAAAAKGGACMREGGRLAGARPVSIATLKRPPKKTFDVRPSFPPLPSTVRGSGSWTGEVLLDQRGRVAHVWPIHEPRLRPPVPAFNAAIV